MAAPNMIPMYQVDAFTPTPYGGNPAAVCLLSSQHLPLSDAARQLIAAENNLSETAFLEIADSEEGDFSSASRFKLRWFTPTMEVPLCGHATLASAAALLGPAGNSSAELTFDTLSGPLVVTSAGTAGLEMKLPIAAPTDPVPAGADVDSRLVKALAGGLPVKEACFNKALRYLVVVLAPEVTRRQLEELEPDLADVANAIDGEIVQAGIVTIADAAAKPQVLSRFFAPAMGVPEDPVTGSAHSVLSPYWSDVLGVPTLSARQCSARGGELLMTTDKETGRVRVVGQSAVVLEGKIVPPEGV